jgi:hypothetical protein
MRAPFRISRHFLFNISAVALAGALGAGCLTTPVAVLEPTTRTTLSIPVKETAVDKIDLLFAIDNSASMGDKQAILSEAIPDLLERFVIPYCVDPENQNTNYGPSKNGACARGELEFKPITDIHIGIVSSSIGGRGASSCNTGRTDDHGRLLNVSYKTQAPLAVASPSGFLAWFPGAKAATSQPSVPAISDVKKLVESFQDLVKGVGEAGCGFEAQNESWYRFLVQPDPYERIELGEGRATLVGIDDALLKQRKEFLRPDSLVAIIQVTDENESTVDPLSVSGTGWAFASEQNERFDGLRSSAACATDPYSAECGTCLDPRFSALPECAKPYGEATHTKNLRFFDTKRRFGVDPQFPLARYVLGLGRDASGAPLSKPRVPNRQAEHPTQNSSYVGEPTCTNPLFAKSLPSSSSDELCNLAPGRRDPNLVFFATITGVSPSLLHFDPKNADASKLTQDDWTKILGRDPLRNDTTGADPKMIESAEPRAGLTSQGDDGVHSREYDTRRRLGSQNSLLYNDLQYACTFPLSEPRTCSIGGCDCIDSSDSPLCDASDRNTQLRAKAYPGIRHLALAKAVGDHGIVASICPLETRDKASELYGYRPAARTIVDRLRDGLTTPCLSRPLSVDAEGRPPCAVFEVLRDPGSDAACDAPGRSRIDAKTRAGFVLQQRDTIANVEERPICAIEPIVVPGGASCTTDDRAGFCYVHGAPALAATRQKCANVILFSRAGNPSKGADVVLQCITSTSSAR